MNFTFRFLKLDLTLEADGQLTVHSRVEMTFKKPNGMPVTCVREDNGKAVKRN